MHFKAPCVFLLLVVSAICGISGTPAPEDVKPKPTSTVAPATTSSEPASTTAAPVTTSAPETTSVPTTSTTTAPTTSAPPTTPPATTTTTVAPTTPPVTTTVAPPPTDGKGNWTVHEGNVTCIFIQTLVSAEISYPTPNKTNTVTVHVPASASATGSCGADRESLELSFGPHKVDMTFSKNNTEYYLSNVILTVVVDNTTFPNVSDSWLNQTVTFERNSTEFKTNFNHSYRCTREQSLPLFRPKLNSSEAVLLLSQVQLQAFGARPYAMFEAAQDCEMDTPDIVPIAVGCALAGLVLIVLVAYLVGRRRSQARGYLSIFLE